MAAPNGGDDTGADQTFTITITGENDAPTAVNDTDSTDEDTAINRNAGNGVIDPNDTDPDTTDVLTVDQVEGAGGNVGNAVSGDNGGQFTINGDGSYSFDPNGAFEDLAVGDSRTTTVTYRVSDGEGGTDTATLTVTVTGENDAPTAVNDTDSTDEDTAINRNAGNGVIDPNDTDPDTTDVLTVDQVEGAGGNVGNAVSGDNGGQFTINGDGSYSFDPNGAFEDLAVGESRTTTVTYRVSDGEGGTDTATLTVTVTGENDAPTAVNDTDSTDEDTAINRNAGNGVIDPNDTDPEAREVVAEGKSEAARGNVGSAGSGDNG